MHVCLFGLLMQPDSSSFRYVFSIYVNSRRETVMNPGTCSELPSSDSSKHTLIAESSCYGGLNQNLHRCRSRLLQQLLTDYRQCTLQWFMVCLSET